MYPSEHQEYSSNSSQGRDIEQDDSERSEKSPRLPRLIPRNLPFDQSHNTLEVEHNHGFRLFQNLLKHDLFHIMLRWPAYVSITILLIIWTLVILLFAGVYVAVDARHPELACGLGPAGSPISFYGAFAFSLETCTTVGYGLPSSTNAFFLSCSYLQISIYFQMVWSMLFNAFLFAFFYSRVARGEARAVQVIFSNKAIVSIVRGQVRFQMRVFDVDAKHPIVEAHVRVYCVKNDRPVPMLLRLVKPNDELNAMVFLSFPSVVAHHIDCYSLLHPYVPSLPVQPMGLTLRQADSMTSNRPEIICPACGEGFGTIDRFKKHVLYMRIIDVNDEIPFKGSHQAISDDKLAHGPARAPLITNLGILKEHFRDEIAEVFVILEGMDPLTSLTFSALQSYRFEDIIWSDNAAFYPCISAMNNKYVVDLDRFNTVSDQSIHATSLNITESDREVGSSRQIDTVHENSYLGIMNSSSSGEEEGLHVDDGDCIDDDGGDVNVDVDETT